MKVTDGFERNEWINETGTFLFILKEEKTILKSIGSAEEYMNSGQPQPHKKLPAEFNAHIQCEYESEKVDSVQIKDELSKYGLHKEWRIISNEISG